MISKTVSITLKQYCLLQLKNSLVYLSLSRFWSPRKVSMSRISFAVLIQLLFIIVSFSGQIHSLSLRISSTGQTQLFSLRICPSHGQVHVLFLSNWSPGQEQLPFKNNCLPGQTQDLLTVIEKNVYIDTITPQNTRIFFIKLVL